MCGVERKGSAQQGFSTGDVQVNGFASARALPEPAVSSSHRCIGINVVSLARRRSAERVTLCQHSWMSLTRSWMHSLTLAWAHSPLQQHSEITHSIDALGLQFQRALPQLLRQDHVSMSCTAYATHCLHCTNPWRRMRLQPTDREATSAAV